MVDPTQQDQECTTQRTPVVAADTANVADVAGTTTHSDIAPKTVGIVGLGLIGGSLARRLVNAGMHVLAYNHRPHPYEAARADGIECFATPEELVSAKPDVIVLCNPLKAMPDILAHIAPCVDKQTTTLTDVGSVKALVRAQVADAGLDDCYVGAHPMAGNEKSGWSAADPTLFDNALWAVCVDETTERARVMRILAMITTVLQNSAIVINDAVHDKAAAQISHMPHAVATALINEISIDANRAIDIALAAGSWRDMTRVALTDPDRTRAMVEENAANVEDLLRDMASRLVRCADALHDHDEAALDAFFTEGDAYRTYKVQVAAAQTADTALQTTTFNIATCEHWQRYLLKSAQCSQRIIDVQDASEVVIALDPTMSVVK